MCDYCFRWTLISFIDVKRIESEQFLRKTARFWPAVADGYIVRRSLDWHLPSNHVTAITATSIAAAVAVLAFASLAIFRPSLSLFIFGTITSATTVSTIIG